MRQAADRCNALRGAVGTAPHASVHRSLCRPTHDRTGCVVLAARPDLLRTRAPVRRAAHSSLAMDGKRHRLLWPAGCAEQGIGHAAAVVRALPGTDRKSVVEGKSVSVRVDLGGGRIIKKK